MSKIIFLSLVRQSVFLVSVLLLASCESGGSGGVNENPTVEPLEAEANTLFIEQPALEWRPCDEDELLECATLVVPMDYSNLSGETINIGIARSLASAETRQRTLLINPGGPGAGGVVVLGLLVRFADIPNAIEQSHDLVSFDPRGIGRSTPLQCSPNVLFSQDIYPVSRAEVQQNLDLNIEFSQNCFNEEGEYLQQLGSGNVVRDMNEIRKALLISQFDFLGYSYGTRLAALYMQAFPEHTGRFVLDGSVSPDSSVLVTFAGGLLPAQRNIDSLVAACIGDTTICNPFEFANQLQSKADELGEGADTFESALLYSLLRFVSENPGFEQFFIEPMAAYLETGDVDMLENLFEALGLGESLEAQTEFNIAAYFGVLCADDPVRPTIDSIESVQAALNADSDLLAEMLYATVSLCAGWPESLDPMPLIATNQAPPSLVIGGSTDAQTPLIFSEQMAAAVGGQFLFSEHDGHTTVFSGTNRCTEAAVENFLSSGTLPATGVCEASGAVRSKPAAAWHKPSIRMLR